MKLPRVRHRWDLSPQQAFRLQQRLASEVREEPLQPTVRFVAGGDASFTSSGTHIIAGWVVWDLFERAVVDRAVAKKPIRFPYVPGLLSFREAPSLIAAARKLKTEPDVFMFDGHGKAHPRQFGLACHVSLLFDRPGLGCGKSRLCGEYVKPGEEKGKTSPLLLGGECIGRVVRTRTSVSPVFISTGHRITLDDAVTLALRCCTQYRLPEPTRLAHQLVTEHRTK